MKFFCILFLSICSCVFGCCSSNKSQEEGLQKEIGIPDTTHQPTIQRYNISTISAIVDSVVIIDTAMYRLYIRAVATNSEGGESILLGQSLELQPHYIYNDRSAIDWSIEINRKLRSVRNIHPGGPVTGKMMLDQRQHWLLVDVNE